MDIVCYILLAFSHLLAGNAQEIKVIVQPTPADERNNLIWFNSTSYSYWAVQLDNFLEPYRQMHATAKQGGDLVYCYGGNPSLQGKVCRINPDKFSPCITTNYFGYRSKTPCIFLQITSEKGWKPKYYKDFKTLPAMPRNLKNYITERSSVLPFIWETLWVSCDGETVADKEFIGPIHYIPGPGIPGYFFPYMGQKGYLPPLVAVQFKKPSTGMLINVECKTWAANIKTHKGGPVGTVKFQLMID